MNILGYIASNLSDLLFGFAFYYPLFMSYLWMIGALYYYFHWEKAASPSPEEVPEFESYPGVSILVPCHNEAANIRETIQYLLNQHYPNFEVIAINDGSEDNTGEILDELSAVHERLRVVHLATNQGKAMGLRMGAMVSPHEYVIGIDGDALLDANATTWIMHHLINGPRVGAVTGNPRVRTRSTLLGKLQVGEFSSIIGLIKRAQRIYGRVFTVSGVVAGFRKAALQDVGYWSLETLTEDIDISWKLQLHHWDVRYEPNALCWILMPETIRGLWRQRLRWAQGGSEAMMKYSSMFGAWKLRRMWPIYFEYFISVAWSYTMITIFILWGLGRFIEMPPNLFVSTLLPGWNGVILGMTCLMQFAVSLTIDSRYERSLSRYYYWMIWYPLIYWILNVFTTVVALLRTAFTRRGKRATWRSTDRGLRPHETT
jgi:biofilm PGA synthesis N-glycosyltransferase PgaC